MSLLDKSILVVTDDATTQAMVTAAVQPLVKTLVTVSNSTDGIQKLNNQTFDAFILRTKAPVLNDPKQIFQWTQLHKPHKTTPWVVIGKDIEDEQIVITHNHVKFLPKLDDAPGLVTILKGMFFTAEEGQASSPVDVNFVNPLVAAVIEVLRSMGQIEVKRGAPYVRKATDLGESHGEISGIIAMNSDRFLGSMAICFQRELILKVYENMLGAKTAEIDADVKDAVSEMTNIIFGNAKRDLNAAGHTIAMAIPSVVTGKDHQISHSVSGHRFCIPFESSFGRVVVECVISMKK